MNWWRMKRNARLEVGSKQGKRKCNECGKMRVCRLILGEYICWKCYEKANTETLVALSRKVSKVALVALCLISNGCAGMKTLKVSACTWGGQTCVHQVQVPVPHGRGRR